MAALSDRVRAYTGRADAELITLADRIRDEAAEAGVHPMLLAAQRIAASRPEKLHPS